MNLQSQFLEHINRRCWEDDANLKPKKVREKAFLLLRFHPDNLELTHLDIAQKMQERAELQGVKCENAIGTTAKNVVGRIVSLYETEMKADGVDANALLNCQRGGKLPAGKNNSQASKRFSPWEEVYKWLWNCEFTRWQINWFWKSWQEKALRNSDWIGFTGVDGGGNRKMKVPLPRKQQEVIIEVDKPLLMHVDLQYPGRYLLLLNRGLDARYVVCPSQAFAPNCLLEGNGILMPQEGAMCEEIEFDSPGREEYLAIVSEQAFDFPWLVPSESDPAPIWDATRLSQLWNSLEGQSNCQVFYQSFTVR